MSIDILAPVGNAEMLTAAVYSGADSIYCGLKGFNARQNAENFDGDALQRAVSFCHARNVKVNVTLNTLLYNKEIPEFIQSLRAVCSAGADAVIVQDLAAAKLVKSLAPSIELHGSTQMAVHTLEGALALKELGFSRVILARELSREQIVYITKNCGIETEMFVHGALCVCLSGQCYMSAFLGGRSGNRGLCAGTCRLPFKNEGVAYKEHALSLKDLSLVPYLQEIKEMGVSCIKIEGRMRTPEYVATAVTACRNSLQGNTFDEELLEGVFSRSGFTDGFYTGNVTKEVFGRRTQENMDDTKQTLPKVRELYRRELQKVPVHFTLTFDDETITLHAKTDTETVELQAPHDKQTAQKDPSEAYKKSLSKTGGTPFYSEGIEIQNPANIFIPASTLNDLRSRLLENLLNKREIPSPHFFDEEKAVAYTEEYTATKKSGITKSTLPISFRVRLAGIFQLSEDLMNDESIAYFVLPLREAGSIPESLKAKTILELPRSMFNGTDELKKDIEKAKTLGFTAFEAGNIGHIPLLEGLHIHGGFTLNVANSLASNTYAEMGVESLTLSPELPLENIADIQESTAVTTGILGYGHLPLMLTRACPVPAGELETEQDKAFLTDRKNAEFLVQKAEGAYHIHNPIPLYMGDRLHEVPCSFVTLYFTAEEQDEVKTIFEMFKKEKPFEGPYTRGLYYKGAI